MRIKAQLLHMAANEIRAMIPTYLMEEIKRHDPSPLFKAFVVGQEGKAEATWVGVGKVVKNWFADAIGVLSRKIYAGMRLYHNHSQDAPGDRTALGEVVGTRTKMIDGKFSAVIAAYIYPEYKKLPLNIASIEADINVDTADPNGDVHAAHIDNVQAIALGDEMQASPGFPGATLLGTLNAFKQESRYNKEGDKMDLTEIKEYCKTNGIQPSQIFGHGVLREDISVQAIIKDERADAATGEHKHRTRTDEAFIAKETEWKTSDEAKDKIIADLKRTGAKNTAGGLFTKKITDRKLDEKQKAYMELKLADYEVNDPEEVEKEVDSFMDKTLENFKKEAKIFGVEDHNEETDLTPGSEPTPAHDGDDSLMPA